MARNVREWCEHITILKWFVSRFGSQRQSFNRCFNYNYIYFYGIFDRSSALLGKTAKLGASKVQNKHGKDSTAMSLSKQDVGKSRTESKVSIGLCGIWERNVFVFSGNSTSEVTEKRSAISQRLSDWIDHHVYLCTLQFTFPSLFSGRGAGEHLISPKLVFIAIHDKIPSVLNFLFSTW